MGKGTAYSALLRDERARNPSSIPVRGERSLPHCVQTGSGVHPASDVVGTDVFSLGVKLPVLEADCPPPPHLFSRLRMGGAIPLLHMPSWRAWAQFYYYFYICDGRCFQCVALLDKRMDADGTTHGRVWLQSAIEGQTRNSVKCKTLFIGFARLRYLWKVMANRKHDNVTFPKFRRQTYISVCVLPFQITRWERKCHEVNREALTVAHCSL
jgi:hypothetical protein